MVLFTWCFSASSSPLLDGIPITVPPFWTNPHTLGCRTPLGYKSGSRLVPELTRGLCQPAGSCAALLRALSPSGFPPQPHDGPPPPHSCLQETLGFSIFRFQDDDVLMVQPQAPSCPPRESGLLCTQPTGAPEPWGWEVHLLLNHDFPF